MPLFFSSKNITIKKKFLLPSFFYSIGLVVIFLSLSIFYNSYRQSNNLIIDLVEQKNILSQFEIKVANISQDLVRLLYLKEKDRDALILASAEGLAAVMVDFRGLALKHDLINDMSLAEEIEPSIDELRLLTVKIVGFVLTNNLFQALSVHESHYVVQATQILNFVDEAHYGKLAQIDSIHEDIELQLKVFMVILLIEFILVFIVLYISYVRIAKQLVDPIKQLQHAANIIVKYYSLEEEVEDYFSYSIDALQKIDSQDELGLLSNDFKKMISSIKLGTKERMEVNHQLLIMNKQLINTQGQLLQSAKLASIGEISAGLAHELNQPLGAIKLSAEFAHELMGESKVDDKKVIAKLERIMGQVDRAAKIINHLKVFSRQGEHEFSQTDMNWVVEESFVLLAEILKMASITLTLELASDLPKVNCDYIQIEQVLTNLVTNARDAMEESDDKRLIVCSYLSGDNVCVDVQDRGKGMSEALVAKIFDPFFTTKKVGKGTGLGMSISYGIIQEHGGMLLVSSEEGQGSCFTLSLPQTRLN
ncbi:MAG: ATP-binding protein [Bermanella sp.]